MSVFLNAFQQNRNPEDFRYRRSRRRYLGSPGNHAFGLLVAIPAVMTFNYFTGKVEAFDVEMDNSSSELIDYFIKQSHER